jgi:hypothetical protein
MAKTTQNLIVSHLTSKSYEITFIKGFSTIAKACPNFPPKNSFHFVELLITELFDIR